MNLKPGEIYLIDLGFVGKVRPAVVVSREDKETPRAVGICVPLTTQNRGSLYEVPMGKLKFLDKPSWANAQGIAAVGHEKFLRRLGRIGNEELSEIRKARDTRWSFSYRSRRHLFPLIDLSYGCFFAVGAAPWPIA